MPNEFRVASCGFRVWDLEIEGGEAGALPVGFVVGHVS